MKPLNTFPIEDFLDKAKVCVRTNQKTLSLSQKEVADLAASISSVMARLLGQAGGQSNETITISMDGGKF